MPTPLIGTGRRDRYPKEDARLRRGLSTQVYVPFIGAGFDVDLGAHSLTALRFFSTETTLSGLSPFVVASTVVVTHLNADLLDGQHMPTYTTPLSVTAGASPVVSLAGLTTLGTANYLVAVNAGGTGWTYIDPATVSGVPSSRTISTTSPLTGGGDLSANRTFGVGGLTTIGTATYLVRVNAAGTGWEYVAPSAIVGGYVPYTGATGDVNLGVHGLSAGGATFYPNANSVRTLTVKGDNNASGDVAQFQDQAGNLLVAVGGQGFTEGGRGYLRLNNPVPSDGYGVGIQFNSNSRTGLFQMDSSGAMVFRSYNGAIYFDNPSGLPTYFRMSGYATVMTLLSIGGVSVSALRYSTLPPVYLTNALALAGGLVAGQTYRTGLDPDTLCVVH